MTNYIAYYRVSTGKQEASGLGLAAQRETVRAYVKSRSGTMVAEYSETASGGKADRAGLTKAMDHCRETGATLVVSKLDRLTRRVSDIMEQGVDIAMLDISVDTSTPAGRLMVNMMMSFAQFEREIIAQRTRDGLAQARKCPKRAATLPEARARARQQAYLAKHRNTIETVRTALGDSFTLREAVLEFEAVGLRTPTGNAHWHPMTAKRVLEGVDHVPA